MQHANALTKFIGANNSNPEIIPPGTPTGEQDGENLENVVGGLSTNSQPFLTEDPSLQSLSSTKNPAPILTAPSSLQPVSTLTVPPKKTEKILSNVIYNSEFPDKMLLWFMSREKFRIITETAYWKNGEERIKQIQIPNPPPHFSEFARELGTTERQLKAWVKKYPEFAEAHEACKAIIKEFLIDNGLLKNYDPTFAKFAATNLTDMKEKSEVLKRTIDLNKILDKAEKSSSPFDDIDI